MQGCHQVSHLQALVSHAKTPIEDASWRVTNVYCTVLGPWPTTIRPLDKSPATLKLDMGTTMATMYHGLHGKSYLNFFYQLSIWAAGTFVSESRSGMDELCHEASRSIFSRVKYYLLHNHDS